MAGESVSFRITRTTEDLAQTVAALSQRLVKLEQRLNAMELQLDQVSFVETPDPEELSRLDHVETLLADCRSLLQDGVSEEEVPASVNPHEDEFMAA